MKISRFHQLMQVYLKTSNPRPVLLTGQPGCGKSSAVSQLVEMMQQATDRLWQYVQFHPVVDDPTDYKGMPYVLTMGDNSKRAVFLPFGNLEKLVTATEPTIALADDVGQAMGGVQAALMQLFLAREINGIPVSPEVRFFAATNRLEDQAGVTGMLTPLLDRFATVVNLDIDLEDWVRWYLRTGAGDPSVSSWVRHKPSVLTDWKPSREFKKQGTPRSIAWMGELVKVGLTDIEVLGGAVGEHLAGDYHAYLRVWQDLPAFEEIIANPDAMKIPTKMDVRHATCGMIASRVKKDTLGPAVQYLKRMPDEFAVYAMKDAASRDPKLMNTKAFEQFVLDHPAAFGLEVI